MRWGTFDRIELQLTAASLVIATTLNATILFLYGWLLEAACGATLGKVLVGSRVVRTTQRGALAACAVARFSEDCRRPRLLSGGDYRGSVFRGAAANRRYVRAYAVIKEEFGIAARVSAIVLWVVILAGAGWAVPRICSANNRVPTRYLNQVVVRIGRTGNSVYLRIASFTLDVHS